MSHAALSCLMTRRPTHSPMFLVCTVEVFRPVNKVNTEAPAEAMIDESVRGCLNTNSDKFEHVKKRLKCSQPSERS